MYISNVNSASIKLKSIESERVAVEEAQTIHSEDNLILLYIHKGALNYKHDGHQGEIKKRDLVILNPRQSIEIEPIRKIEWIQIKLTGILFTSSLEINSENQLFIISDTSQTLKQYLDLALIEKEQRFRGSEIILKKLLECVMVHILRNNELSIKDSSIQVKHNEIEIIQQYIRDNFSKKLTLDDLSELVNINKYYLIRLFKQQTGLSPIDYLIHVRLAEAEKLLAHSNVTVSKISDMVGFHSPSHFSKTFKESNHCTPSTYRKRYASKNESTEIV
ncbi:helix-turn-helix domain-containing protein [Aerococcaceae bacterium DSM 109653]|uniref:Helix-turn-helix domain-containing protein n=1 Tax=Fundicoccus ignavus TaxID=2664442 RepID=A0A6I2GZ18_9LACT|nr:AraC family transcriptional regulator [Fundicoccus ignavus]MRI82478.1 helix-turn-helix domain-containing protein [Fundicoccus ignavus]MRI85683.1 helix-turn-helix domain-containing protein [Fundicoccus ignavus]